MDYDVRFADAVVVSSDSGTGEIIDPARDTGTVFGAEPGGDR